MKITFLEPIQGKNTEHSFGAPLGLAYIASYLEKNVDEKFEFSIEVDVDRAIQNKPDIIGISTYTRAYFDSVAAAEKIKKELNIPVIIGGKHITALPSNLRPCFDLGVIGEGEIVMAELIQTYMEKKGFFPEDLSKINGLVFRDGNELHITPDREPIKDIDILPPPKRSILWAYLPSGKRLQWAQAINTSRGCPYKCPFCINSKKKFLKVRFHSPERVVSELEEIVTKFPKQDYIAISDDLFVTSKKRLKNLVDLITSEKLHRKVAFTCMCKADRFDEEVAVMLKKMNVKKIGFGFESADKTTLRYLKDDSSDVEEHIRAINICDKYGIYSTGFFIIGAPPETREGLSRTYWFIREYYPPMRGDVFHLKPYPGTKVWDYFLEKGMLNEEKENWKYYGSRYFEDGKSIFLNENYDYEFFKNALSYFNYLPERDKGVLNNIFAPPREKYYYEIFDHLKEYNLNNEDKILEIGTSYFPSIKDILEKDKEITRFEHWIYRSNKEKIQEYENLVLGNSQFDIILFSHCLEQILDPYNKLKYFINNHLKDDGKLIIIVRNIKYIQNILNLLKGGLDVLIKGFKRYDDFFNISIGDLKNNLVESGLKNIDQVEIIQDISKYSGIFNPLIPIFSDSQIKNNLLVDAEIYSYILVAQKM